MAKAVEFEKRDPFLDAAEALAALETSRGTEAAILAALNMLDVAGSYLIQQRGAAYMLDEFAHSVRITHALAREINRVGRD